MTLYRWTIPNKLIELLGQMLAVMMGTLLTPFWPTVMGIMESALAPYIDMNALLSSQFAFALLDYMEAIRAADPQVVLTTVVTTLLFLTVFVTVYLAACSWIGLSLTRMVLKSVERKRAAKPVQ